MDYPRKCSPFEIGLKNEPTHYAHKQYELHITHEEGALEYNKPGQLSTPNVVSRLQSLTLNSHQAFSRFELMLELGVLWTLLLVNSLVMDTSANAIFFTVFRFATANQIQFWQWLLNAPIRRFFAMVRLRRGWRNWTLFLQFFRWGK